MQIVNW